MTKLEFFNKFLFQLFFFRLVKSANAKTLKVVAWGIIFAIPFTGWGSSYIPASPKFRRLWRVKS